MCQELSLSQKDGIVWHLCAYPLLPAEMSSPKAALLDGYAEKDILQRTSICKMSRADIISIGQCRQWPAGPPSLRLGAL